jgi:hypothetical protein
MPDSLTTMTAGGRCLLFASYSPDRVVLSVMWTVGGSPVRSYHSHEIERDFRFPSARPTHFAAQLSRCIWQYEFLKSGVRTTNNCEGKWTADFTA